MHRDPLKSMHVRTSVVDGLLFWGIRTLTEAEIEQPRLETQLLLAHALGVSRTAIIAHRSGEVSTAQQARFESLIADRARRMPFAYLRGVQEFYGLPFQVGPGALIPRPETEMLVEAVIHIEASDNRRKANPFRFADVGTGSGCIAIAALSNRLQAVAVAFDLSAEALEFARRNAALNGVTDRIRFVQSDLLGSVRSEAFDLIVSNPPYIPSAQIETLQPEVSVYEPRIALDGGPDGLKLYRRLARDASRALVRSGRLYVEVGMGQAKAVTDLLRTAGLIPLDLRRDLAGIERVVAAQKPD